MTTPKGLWLLCYLDLFQYADADTCIFELECEHPLSRIVLSGFFWPQQFVLFFQKSSRSMFLESEKTKDHPKMSITSKMQVKPATGQRCVSSRNVHTRYRLSTRLLTAVAAKASRSAFEQLANREALCPSFLLHKNIEIE